MAVAFDAFSVSAGGTGTQTWTHTPVGSPAGVIVFVGMFNSTDEISTVTYGGVSMTEMAGSPNLLAGGELGGVHAFFLGSSIPIGAQSVVATATGSTGNKAGFAITITGSGNTEIVDVDATINNTAVANPSITLSLAGRTCFAALGFYSGQNSAANVTPLAGWTSQNEAFGTEGVGCYTFDTIGSSDVTAGWTQTSDDAVAIAVAVSEVAVGGGSVRIHNLGLLGVGF